MKIIITHASPDWDAIAAVWLLKKFLPGWENASIQFVPAGERHGTKQNRTQNQAEISSKAAYGKVIEEFGEDEVIHVDTGLGPLDHHQTDDYNVSSASLVWEMIKSENLDLQTDSEKIERKKEAIQRIIKIITDTDHFKEVFWKDADSDYHEFSLLGLLEGLKLQKPGQDSLYIDFGINCLDATLHNFENRIWAEKEIQEKGKIFNTKWGKALAIETVNDSVLKLSQKQGYVLVVRKDPRKGYVRIKARPSLEVEKVGEVERVERGEVDLTNLYEKLSKIDPEATWFLHVSKKMLLNGTPKNPKMKATKLSLSDIIRVIETI